jgi:hypothetical protein
MSVVFDCGTGLMSAENVSDSAIVILELRIKFYRRHLIDESQFRPERLRIKCTLYSHGQNFFQNLQKIVFNKYGQQ